MTAKLSGSPEKGMRDVASSQRIEPKENISDFKDSASPFIWQEIARPSK